MKRLAKILGVLVVLIILFVIGFIAVVEFLRARSGREIRQVVAQLTPGTSFSDVTTRLGQAAQTFTSEEDIRVGKQAVRDCTHAACTRPMRQKLLLRSRQSCRVPIVPVDMTINPVVNAIKTDVLRKFIKDVKKPRRAVDAWGVELVDRAGARVGHINFRASDSEAMEIVEEARLWLKGQGQNSYAG